MVSEDGKWYNIKTTFKQNTTVEVKGTGGKDQ
jgi:hypothetical protein